MTKLEHYNLIIVGAGPAGLTSAIYSARSGMSTLVIEKMLAGGAMATAPSVENYPGQEKITGFDLAQKMKKHALESGAIIKEIEPVEKLELKEKIKKVHTNNGIYNSDALIIATGGERRKLGVKGEAEFTGKGVSYCAVCDGALYKGKKVAVVGGSNCAASAALYLNKLSCDVYLIHRRERLRCEGILDKQIRNSTINLIWNSTIKEIKGNQILRSIILTNKKTASDKEIELDGLFIEIGIIPNSLIASEAGVKITETGYILVDRYMQTNINGVYAAGDVTGSVEQISVAVGEGTTAYNSAYEYINQGKYPTDACIQ